MLALLPAAAWRIVDPPGAKGASADRSCGGAFVNAGPILTPNAGCRFHYVSQHLCHLEGVDIVAGPRGTFALPCAVR